MLKDIQDLTTPGIVKGLNTQYNILSLQKEQSPNMMNVVVNFDGSIEKRLGSNTMNSAVISGQVGADFNPAGTGTAELTTMIGAWWNLDEFSGNRGSQFNNLSLSANSGTGYTAGVRNQAALFIGGSNQSLSRATSPYLVGGDSSLSIASWIYMESSAGTLGLPIATKMSKSITTADPIIIDSADKLVLRCNGVGTSFSDSSTENPKTVSPVGNAKQLNMPSGVTSKTAGFFNGTTDYVLVDDSADWDFATGDYEVQFYINMITVQTCHFVDFNTQNFAVIYSSTSGGIVVYQAGTARITQAWTPSANTWYKIKVARVSGVTTLYINDVAQTTTYSGSDNIAGGTTGVYIGRRQDVAQRYLCGWMKNLTITKAASLVLDVRFDSTSTTPWAMADSSTITCEVGKTCTPNGSMKKDFFIPFGDGCMGVWSLADYVKTAYNSDFDMSTGDWTAEAYVRNHDKSNNSVVLFGKHSGSAAAWISWINMLIPRWYIYWSGSESSFITPPAFNDNVWYHLAVTRSSNTIAFWINGTSAGTFNCTGKNFDGSAVELKVGSLGSIGSQSKGVLYDNVRISKGIARYVSAFTAPSIVSATSSQFEYSLYINSSQIVQFDVSSSGLVSEGSVMATSMGALSTAAWYHVVAFHHIDSGYLGITVNATHTTTAGYTSGITNGTSDFYLGSFQGNTGATFDGRIDMTGVWNARLISSQIADLYNSGSGNYYQEPFEAYPWASFDFGASSLRWLTCSHGTGVFASSNLGITWVAIATDRSATYQYLDRSKNVLIMTSDAYDEPLYWAGSAGTYAAIVGNSSPHCKYSINFQGYLILLNKSTAKRSFNYIDENLQLTSTGWLNFDLPSSADDEITTCFILRRYLYVSTRYKIFRVSYVGGNPDWQYVEVKNWGFMPRTAKKIVITNNQPGMGFYYSIGEVVVGMTFDRKIRIFDGSGDQIISNNVEFNNGECEFALDNIAYFGSGPVISFAEVDANKNVYKLCLAIGKQSSQTTHFLNYDGRSMALYPFSNMHFNCMCMAESSNQRFLMAFDRSGYCHMMDSGNLDGNSKAIDDYFDSPIIFNKTPSQSSKGYKTDMFFSNTTSGSLYYYDRVDLNNSFTLKRNFKIAGSANKVLHYESIDVPDTYNTYQFRISSSSGTENPWLLQRYDHFTKGLGIGINSYD